VLLGVGIGRGGEFDGGHGAGEGDEPGAAPEGELEEGEVAVTDENLGVASGGGVIEERQEPAASVAAAEGEEGVDPGIPEHGVQVGGAVGVGAGGESVAVEDVASGLHAVPAGFEVADGAFHVLGGAGRAGGGDEADDGAGAEAGRADRLHGGDAGDRRARGKDGREWRVTPESRCGGP
jgi:hypothetical protein